MPYTIVDDGDEINIRAVITQRWELAELVTKLQARVDGLPVNLTTMIGEKDNPLWGKAQAGTLFTGEKHEPDAQDVNRKELKDE